MATVTIDTGVSHQTMKGFEAVAEAGQEYLMPAATYEYPSTSFANYQSELLTRMAELGLSRFRIEVRAADKNATGYDVGGDNPATQPSINPSEYHFEHVDRQVELILDYEAFIGKQTWWNLCLVDYRDAGYAMENTPAEYATFMLTIVQHIWDTYNRKVDSVESILEPASGQNATHWTRQKQAENIVAGAELLITNGFTGIEWVGPTLEDGSITRSWMTDMDVQNPDWRLYVKEISYHRYTSPSDAELALMLTNALANGADGMSMSELTGATHLHLATDLTIGGNTSWQQFTITFPWSGASDNGGAYFQVNTSTWAVTFYSRAKYLRHYAPLMQIGAVRKDATIAGTGSGNGLPIAFQDTQGRVGLVVKCTGAVTFDIAGLPNGTYEVRYTTGDGTNAPSAYWQSLSDEVVSGGGNTGNIAMPAAGAISIIDALYGDSAPAPPSRRPSSALRFWA